MNRTTNRNHSKGSILVGAGIALGLVSGGLLGGYLVFDKGGEPVPIVQQSKSVAVPVAETRLSPNESVVIQVLGTQENVQWRQLGIKQTDAGKVSLDRVKSEAYVQELKQRFDRSPQDARMDLEARKIVPEVNGQVIDLYGAITALNIAAQTGAAQVTFPTVAVPADVTTKQLGIDDISNVLASFKTKFVIREKFRNDNLKLAASKIHGYVMQPGAEFSFNEVVGARTEREGYKIAHVIQSGEMVDGLAGGTCQISTTLHGAAFFAGIGIVTSIPHSRPSSYAAMGLDATVVYPTTDLKLRNDYDFPVAIYFRVARGVSEVKILGRERPYDKIAFERDIRSQISFGTVTREDDNLPVGSMVVDQPGFPGYNLTRYRKFYKGEEVVKTDKWTLQYRPVTEYARLGINPDPNLEPPKKKPKKGMRGPRRENTRIVQ